MKELYSIFFVSQIKILYTLIFYLILFFRLYSCFHMQNILLLFLGFFARLIVQKHKPFIIGVTGTVGKTTITTHIARFLTHHYWSEQVWFSPYHYNWEYWLPLTIIGVKSPLKNPFLWIWVFIVAFFDYFLRILDISDSRYGIDHPGEMDFLLSIAKPDIWILMQLNPIILNNLVLLSSIEIINYNLFSHQNIKLYMNLCVNILILMFYIIVFELYLISMHQGWRYESIELKQ